MKLDLPPAEKPFEQLTDFQHQCLRRVADRRDKSFVCVSGEPGDKNENVKNIVFNDFLHLIELGFFIELDRTHPQYANMLRQFDQKGVVLVMAEMTNRGQWMWERVSHDKWVN